MRPGNIRNTSYAFAPCCLVQENLSPAIDVGHRNKMLEFYAFLQLHRLVQIDVHARLRLALSALIEVARGVLCYWALKRPLDKPDFYHPEASALETLGAFECLM
jgi:hypothetical protein